jgi:hypothetical protein
MTFYDIHTICLSVGLRENRRVLIYVFVVALSIDTSSIQLSSVYTPLTNRSDNPLQILITIGDCNTKCTKQKLQSICRTKCIGQSPVFYSVFLSYQMYETKALQQTRSSIRPFCRTKCMTKHPSVVSPPDFSISQHVCDKCQTVHLPWKIQQPFDVYCTANSWRALPEPPSFIRSFCRNKCMRQKHNKNSVFCLPQSTSLLDFHDTKVQEKTQFFVVIFLA